MSWFASWMLQGIAVIAVLTIGGELLGSAFIRDYGEKWRYDDVDPSIDIDEYLASHGQAGKK